MSSLFNTADADPNNDGYREIIEQPVAGYTDLPEIAARRLVNLKGIPILIVVSEASYHAPYDHCTSKYLTQAGVKNTFVRLPDAGIHGNGHMMMLEKNNLQIAALLKSWVEKNVR